MAHWSVLLAAPLLAYTSPWIGGFQFSAPYLLVPLAAHVGKRYGLTGVMSIAIGGLAFVLSFRGGAWGWFGGNPAVYLIALMVAAIAASERPFSDWLRWPGSEKAASWLAFAAPFLLMLGVATGRGPGGASSPVGFYFSFALLSYFVLFLMGARGVRYLPLALGLVLAAAVTWPLEHAGLIYRFHRALNDSLVYLRIGTLQPISIFAALVALSAGRAFAAHLRGDPVAGWWRRAYLATIVLLLAWQAPREISYVMSFHVLGLPVLLPLAALMLGLLRGARGVVLATAAAVVVLVLVNVVNQAMSEGFGSALHVPLEAPFVAAAYAMLGARIAEAHGHALDFRLLRLPGYILLVLATAGAIAGEGGSTARLALAGVFLLTCFALAAGWSRLRRAMSGTAFEITPERWLAFTTLASLVISVVSNLQETWHFVQQFAVLLLPARALIDAEAAEQLRGVVREMIDVEIAVLVGLITVVSLLAFIDSLRRLARSVPKVFDDVRRIVAYLKARRMPR
jgi:hypothetical protein